VQSPGQPRGGDQDGQVARFASCCPPAGVRIRQLYPEVEKLGRIFRYRASVSYGENKFIEERMFFAEPEFLEIFKFNFIEGNPTTIGGLIVFSIEIDVIFITNS
jgi:putative ABC transport system permease protein